ncbi:T9SS type A sorting domain-containing protein [bacterium]|nr:T9SS type A sorting domain-containing protein [bacterium]
MERIYIIIILLLFALTPLYAQNFISISAGAGHSLALMDDNTVWAWGFNSDGQLGNGATADTSLPVQVLGEGGVGYLHDIIAISAGYLYSLALKNDGTVYAWGENSYGQLGDSGFAISAVPVQVKDSSGTGLLSGIDSISAGAVHCMALASDSTIWVWGSNREGCLGIGSSDLNPHPFPVKVKDSTGTDILRNIMCVSAGSGYSTALSFDQKFWSWGANGDGQLGNDTTLSESLPIRVMGLDGVGFLENIISISAGPVGVFIIYGHSLALDADGHAWAWGRNFNGELGDGSPNPSYTPLQVLGVGGVGILSDIKDVATGMEHSLALDLDGYVYAWGDNYYGTLGDGSNIDRYWPDRVNGEDCVAYLGDIIAISTSHNHNLALKNDGSTIYAWGRNNHGQLGDGSTSNRTCPVQVRPIEVGIPESIMPDKFDISCYPNPFNAVCNIQISSDSRERLDIEIYDITGRSVNVFHNGENGESTLITEANGFRWTPGDATSTGIYLVRISSGESSISRKVVYLK